MYKSLVQNTFQSQSESPFVICVESCPLLSTNQEEVVLIELCLHGLSDHKDNAISGSRAWGCKDGRKHTSRQDSYNNTEDKFAHEVTVNGQTPLLLMSGVIYILKSEYINKGQSVVCCTDVQWTWQKILLKLNHEIAFGFFIVTLTQLLEYQAPRTETLFMDKLLGGKTEILSCLLLNHSCLTFCLMKWVEVYELSLHGCIWVEKHNEWMCL